MIYQAEQPLRGHNIQRYFPQKVILVIEDDESIGEMLVDALSQETPYQALLVSNGLQALNIVRSIKPALVITDYRLPVMNGIELYDHLRAQQDLANTPTIIMSAYLPKEEVKQRQLVSLSKPFDLDDLISTVEQLLDDRPR